MLVCAFRCSAIQGTKNPVERDFMWVCGPCGEVGWEGLEPSTNALKGRCSTIELPTRWRGGRLVVCCRVAILKIIKNCRRDFTMCGFQNP